VVVVTRDLGIAMRFEHKNLEKVIDQCDLQGNCGGIYLGVRWAQPKKVRQRMEAVTVAHRATRWGGVAAASRVQSHTGGTSHSEQIEPRHA
jgi:hypothetical protein